MVRPKADWTHGSILVCTDCKQQVTETAGKRFQVVLFYREKQQTQEVKATITLDAPDQATAIEDAKRYIEDGTPVIWTNSPILKKESDEPFETEDEEEVFTS